MECLVTKLKGVVNDDSLMKLGELRIKCRKISSWQKHLNSIFFTFTEPQTITIIGDGYFTDDKGTANKGKTTTITSNYAYISNTDCEVSIPDKSKLTNLSLSPLVDGKTAASYAEQPRTIVGGLSALIGCSKLETFSLYYAEDDFNGDISALSSISTLKDCKIQSCDVYGDVGSIKSLTNLTSLSLNRCSDVYGDISAFANMVGLTTLDVAYTKVLGSISILKTLINLKVLRIWDTSISGDVKDIVSPLTTLSPAGLTGSLESFVATQRTQGRTEGSCTNDYISWGKLTFNGETAPSSSGTLTWTSTTITCNDTQITA